MIDSRINSGMLIIAILLICIWFYASIRKSRSLYRAIFIVMISFTSATYINRIWEILMLKGLLAGGSTEFIMQKIIHYILSTGIFVLYAFFMGSLVFEIGYWNRVKRWLFLVPCIILDGLIISSPWTGLIFIYEGGEFFEGSLLWYLFLTRLFYAVYGTVVGIVNRKVLPNLFTKCIYLVTFLTFIELLFFIYTNDDSAFYSTVFIDIIILLLALIIVELHKDTQTECFNSEAFEDYIERDINGKTNETVYLIKLKNYNYLKENSNEMALNGTIVELSECIRQYSRLLSIYYLGNGKFSLVVPKKSHFSEKDFLQKLEDRFCVPFDVNGASISLSLFVAVIHLKTNKINKTNFWKFFVACDNIKYKNSGLMEVVYGDSFGIDQIQRYHDIEEAITRALIEKEFKMFYQPIISSETKKVVSCEALLRLHDRIIGFISPEEFIPISEGNGSILDISEFVIDSVFKFVAENDLRALGIEFVEMNLSMIQCMDSRLPDKLKSYAKRYNVDPGFINLEITETATSFDEESLKKQLLLIKSLGFSFSLDDYGTGYSNLVRVLEYPVDVIKVDKAVIWSAFHSRDNYSTLKNLVTMFHDVRRKLVAEGVENEEQVKNLIDIGCDLLQGYYYSKPICEEDFLAFVSRYNLNR